MHKILFISHDASISGAPTVLLNFIRWAKENYNIQPAILLLNGGGLEEQFKELGPVWNFAAHHTNANYKEKIIAKINAGGRKDIYKKRILNEIKDFGPSICYANTIVASPILAKVKTKFNIPVILHVHEMAFSANAYYSEFINPKSYLAVDYFIAVSEGVRHFLEKQLCIAPSKITVIHPFTVNSINYEKEVKIKKNFVIGCSGYGSWQKGFYSLPFLIKEIFDKFSYSSNIEFLWMGFVPPQQKKEIEYMLQKMGLIERLAITGYTKTPDEFYKKMDVFVLLSMEDSFPLVCLEAGAYKIPIVCFVGTGGVNDFIREGGGIAVPFLNIAEMAAAIMKLKSETIFRKEMGNKAAISSKKHHINVIAPKMWQKITEILQ